MLVVPGVHIRERGVSHVLDPGTDHDIAGTGGDLRRRDIEGLLRRPALKVYRSRSRLDRESLRQPRGAADVQALLTELVDAPRDHVIDLGGIDLGARDQLRVSAAEQLRRMQVLEVALLLVPLADRRAKRLDDDYLE